MHLSRGEGGPRGPTLDRPSRRSAGLRSPSSRPPRPPSARGRGLVRGAVPSQRRPSAPDAAARSRPLRLQRARRAGLGLRVAAVLSATPRPPPPGDVLAGLAGASPRAFPMESGRPPPLWRFLRRGNGRRGMAARPAAPRPWPPGVRRTGTDYSRAPRLPRRRPEALGGPGTGGRTP